MKFEAKTKTGVTASFEVEEDGNVIANIVHPKTGEAMRGNATWGMMSGKEGAIFQYAGNAVLLAIALEDWKNIEKASTERGGEHKAGITQTFREAGKVLIGRTHYYGVGFYSKTKGVSIPEEYAKKLEEVHEKFEWDFEGYPGESDMVCSVSAEEIDYKYNKAMEADKAAKEITKEVEESHIKRCIAQAKQTGKKVIVRQYTVDCDDPEEECNTDVITVCVLPNGEKETRRVHTH